jgi:uncharacterized coiled-coil protein SlyX
MAQEYQETMNLRKTLDKLSERLKQVSPLNEEDVEVEEALSNLVFAYLECNSLEDDNVVTIRPKNGRQRITRSSLQKTLDKLTKRLKQVSPLNEEDVEVEEALSNLAFAYLECNTLEDDNVVTIRPKNGRQ